MNKDQRQKDEDSNLPKGLKCIREDAIISKVKHAEVCAMLVCDGVTSSS